VVEEYPVVRSFIQPSRVEEHPQSVLYIRDMVEYWPLSFAVSVKEVDGSSDN
jgi:hypothetical protein